MVYAAAGVDSAYVRPPSTHRSCSRPTSRRSRYHPATQSQSTRVCDTGNSSSHGRPRSRSRCRRRSRSSRNGWINWVLRWFDRFVRVLRQTVTRRNSGLATFGSRCHRSSSSAGGGGGHGLSLYGGCCGRNDDPDTSGFALAATATVDSGRYDGGEARIGCRTCQRMILIQEQQQQHQHQQHDCGRRISSMGVLSSRRYVESAIDEDDDVKAALMSSRESLNDASLRQQCATCRQRVRINVSGQHFEIRAGLLRRHPSTLLGNDYRRRRYYDRRRDEVFIDRHRPTFEAVFAYYMYGGRLRRPSHIPDDVFLAELEFYELEPCAIDDYRRSEGYTEDGCRLPSNPTLRWLWMLFEHPETSTAAYIIAVISVIVTLISIVLFCVETLPLFALTHCESDDAPNFLDPFFVIETSCTIWFTVEVVVRFIASPSKLLFWRDFKNIVDLTAIVPYYITLFNVVSTMSCASAKSSASLAFLRVIRLVRVFKLTKHSIGLQVLILTVKASSEELGLFLVILLVCMLVYSSAIYYAELGVEGSQIQSIPDAFWWAIITMTTVGYGDKVPVGYAGKLVGAACAITGVLTLAMPVPIITGHFNRFYAYKTGRAKHI